MNPVLRVSEFLTLANEVLRLNIQASAFAVEGEISEYKIKDGRWIVFSLKDEQNGKTQLKCFATTYKIQGSFEDGMKVHIFGYPKITDWGDFQMTVEKIEPVGEGALKRAYDLLKLKLEKEGLFSMARKRDLPEFPERIGLITSRDAAAYGDFLRILNNRTGGVKVIHANVHVQGKEAVSEIVEAFRQFESMSEKDRPQVIVLTRGGGSLEDLAAFNDEAVARAVYSSSIPVVCGVGHERDESLCDFVADVRASTPSNAAERVVRDRAEVLSELRMRQERAEEILRRQVFSIQEMIIKSGRLMSFFLSGRQLELETLGTRLFTSLNGWTTQIGMQLQSNLRLLQSVNPGQVLSRGYAFVKKEGKIVSEASQLELGDTIAVQFGRGSAETEVKKIKRN